MPKEEFESIYDRLTKGFVNPRREDSWVTGLFAGEDRYLSSIGAPQLDRPFGSMNKKNVVRKGAYSDVVACAYARWNRRMIPESGLQMLLIEYNRDFADESFDEFLDTRAPRVPYERLVVVTPAAIYSGHSGVVQRYRFENDSFTISTAAISALGRSIRSDVNERNRVPKELANEFGGEGPLFLKSSERERSPSRLIRRSRA